MDTDNLSIQTYRGIISEAEEFNHDLTLQLGLLASNCKDDDDYLNQAESIINEWLSDKGFDIVADDIFFGESVDLIRFRTTLHKLLSNIKDIKKIPMNEREYENW